MSIDEISEIVANRLNLNKEQVKRINRVQWRFLMESMQSGEFPSLNMIYLGKFLKNKKYESGKFRSNLRRMEKPDIQEQTSGGNSIT